MDYVDSELKPVAESVENRFIDLQNRLQVLSEKGEVQLLYRGEDFRNIRNRLQKRNARHEEREVYERAFYFGDKARHFSVDVFTSGRNYLTNIRDESDNTFVFIHDRICKILKEPRLLTRVNKFTSEGFQRYFLKPGSNADFIKKINIYDTDNLKINVRDYYLYLLHVAGSSGIRKETMLVSTSKDKFTAVQFSESAYSGKVIFHYFIPKPFEDYAIGPWRIKHHEKVVSAIGLPLYNSKGLFPRQNEIAVKGALFPKFILGIELVGENKFIINSNFTKNGNMKDIELVARCGFDIDQLNFGNDIFDTAYIRYGEIDGKRDFSSYDVPDDS